jgi:hypothetical protein
MDMKTFIKKLGNRKKIDPKGLDKSNTPEKHILTYLHCPIESTLPFPIAPESDVLLGHHCGETGEPPLIFNHVWRAIKVDHPKALHASHMQNQK